MKGKGGPLTSTWAVMALLILGTAGIGAFLLGGERAWNIGSAAAVAVITDGLLQQTPVHGLDRVDLTVHADVPSEAAMAGTVDRNGVAYPARFTVAVEGKQGNDPVGGTILIDMVQVGPFGPYGKLELRQAGGLSKLEGTLACWIAGRMGGAVPYVELVEVIWNGRPLGIMELRERIGPDLERDRHLGNASVTVFSRDPASDPRELWGSEGAWQSLSDTVGSAAASAAHHAYFGLLSDTLAFPGTGSDSLEKLIDVDAFLRYLAAWTVIHGDPHQAFLDPYLIFSDRERKFYPVFWGTTQGAADSSGLDLLTQRLFAVPQWKSRYDTFVQEAVQDLHTEGNFQRHLDTMVDRLRPAIAADRMRAGPVSDHPEDVMHYSLLHWERAVRQLGTTRYERWRALLNDTSRSNAERHGTQRAQR